MVESKQNLPSASIRILLSHFGSSVFDTRYVMTKDEVSMRLMIKGWKVGIERGSK